MPAKGTKKRKISSIPPFCPSLIRFAYSLRFAGKFRMKDERRAERAKYSFWKPQPLCFPFPFLICFQKRVTSSAANRKEGRIEKKEEQKMPCEELLIKIHKRFPNITANAKRKGKELNQLGDSITFVHPFWLQRMIKERRQKRATKRFQPKALISVHFVLFSS